MKTSLLLHSFFYSLSSLPSILESVRTRTTVSPDPLLGNGLHKCSHFPDGGGETGGRLTRVRGRVGPEGLRSRSLYPPSCFPRCERHFLLTLSLSGY